MDDSDNNTSPDQFAIVDQSIEEEEDNQSGNGSVEEKERSPNPNIELSATADRKRKAAPAVQIINYGLACSAVEKRKRKMIQTRKKPLDRPFGWSPLGFPAWDSTRPRTDSRSIIRDLVKGNVLTAIELPVEHRSKAGTQGQRNKGESPVEIPQGGKHDDHFFLKNKGVATPGLDVSTEISFAEFNEFFTPADFACAETLASVAEFPISYHIPEGALAVDPISYYNRGDDYEEACARLSSILAMNFDELLLDRDMLARTLHLSTELKENSGFNSFQLAMLKMVEEIPLLSDDIVEFNDLNVEVKALFSEMETNLLRVACEWTKYRDSKITLSDLQSDVNSNLQAARSLDNQITNLRARRVELANLIESKKNAMIELIQAQKNIAGTLLETSDDEPVEAADRKDPGGSTEKKPKIDDWAKTLVAFHPLKDFIF